MFKLIKFFSLAVTLVYSPMNGGDSHRSLSSNVKAVADAVNFEGGMPATALKEGQLWANLCVTNQNSAAEATCMESGEGELRVQHAFLSIIHYYIKYARELSQKQDGDKTRLVVQFHRDAPEGQRLNKIEQLMSVCFEDLNLMKIEGEASLYSAQNDVIIELREDRLPVSVDAYVGQDIVLSLNFATGLNPDWSSHALLMPERFVPADLHTMTFYKDRSYEVRNHLVKILSDVLKEQNREIAHAVKASSKSKKALEVYELSLMDFHSATLLQAGADLH